MNRKEIILSVTVMIMLAGTFTFFSSEECFDCRQPLFSESSSCSLVGGRCVSSQAKIGLPGLWESVMRDQSTNQNINATKKCKPDCSAADNKSSIDSVNHTH